MHDLLFTFFFPKHFSSLTRLVDELLQSLVEAPCEVLFLLGLGQRLRQLPRLVQLLQDVQPAHQLAVNVELRVGGPLGVLLQTLPHLNQTKDTGR